MTAVSAISSEVQPRVSAHPASRYFRRLLSGELANKAFRFIAAVVLARALTPAEFGLFNVGIALSGIVVVLGSLGVLLAFILIPPYMGWMARRLRRRSPSSSQPSYGLVVAL